MDLRSLRYAVTLADELHFGRAAARHFISAQPFGQHIQRLERELRVRLFERTSRRVTLTPTGRRVITEARAILAALDTLAEQDRPPLDDQTMTIGVLGFGLADSWPMFIDIFRAQLAGIELVYRELSITDQYTAIQTDQVDVGIVQYVGPVDGLVLHKVLSMPRVAVVPTRSPYADADRLSQRDVEDAAWIPLAASHPRLATWAGPAGQPTRAATQVHNPAAISAAVSMTGLLGLHGAAASRFYPRPDVRFVPLDGPPCEIAVATRETDTRPLATAIRMAAQLLANADEPQVPQYVVS